VNDITPYNGVQPVAENSAAITPEQYAKDKFAYSKVEERVRRAGEIMGTRAVARIDCRRNQQGEFKLFDVNMKPVSSAQSQTTFLQLTRFYRCAIECYWTIKAWERKSDFAGRDGSEGHGLGLSHPPDQPDPSSDPAEVNQVVKVGLWFYRSRRASDVSVNSTLYHPLAVTT
jgi:hypothetical protein